MALEKVLNKVKKGLAVGVIGLASLLPVSGARGDVGQGEINLGNSRPQNIYALTHDDPSTYFYTDIREDATSFNLKIWDGDPGMRIEIYNPNNEKIYALTHDNFSDGEWDILPIPTEISGTYKIKVEQQNLPSQSYANIFGLDVSSDNLYSYRVPFDDTASPNEGDLPAKIWIEKPKGWEDFDLANYDMDYDNARNSEVRIYQPEPDDDLHMVLTGSNYISGNENYKNVTIDTGNEKEYWPVEFSNLDGARWFTVSATSKKLILGDWPGWFITNNKIHLKLIPEPSTLTLLGASALGLAGLRRKRK